MEGRTDWNALAYPRLCGLAAKTPSRLSQAMHNAGFIACGLPFSYIAFPSSDTAFILQAMRKLGWRGLSLTIPHKEAALAHLDVLSAEAQAVAAVNTVINDGHRLWGFNTDTFGIQKSLSEVGFEAHGSSVLVLGAGGAARAAVYTLKQLGASQIIVVNRDSARAERLAASFGCDFSTINDLPGVLQQRPKLIINATPLGENAELSLPLQPADVGPESYVFDFITRPITPLLTQAQSLGAHTVQGTRMLLYQALEQFRLFTEIEAPKTTLESALEHLINQPPAGPAA